MYQRHGMPRTYYSSSQFSPSSNQLPHHLPTVNQSRDQSLYKMSVELTTKRPTNSPLPSNKPEKVQSLPSQIATNFRLFHAIQVSKDKFHIRQVYPVVSQPLADVSKRDGFATATSVTSADNPVSIPALSESTVGGATLILEPSSKAVVGNGGIAISSPVSRAILRKNMGTRVLYRPESVAIAGVGGTAHAQSDLILDYVELRLEHRSDPEELVTNLPFYGGAKGQVLQIRRNPDGTITTEIVKQDKVEIEKEVSEDMNSFQENLASIQKAASELVNLQQAIKSSGKLTEGDRSKYAENLEKLGISAQNLAHIQQNGDDDDFRLLFQGPLFHRQQSNLNLGKTEDANDDEEDVGEQVEDGTVEEETPDTDSIQISTPDDDASIAEAKPVGLAIAGEGGVASSKPIATAVVGPGGLAIARPIATAIAGITPSEVQGLGIPLGSHKTGTRFHSVNIPTAHRYGLTSVSNGIGLLVGPSFSHESRVPEKDISADDSHKEDNKAEPNNKKDEKPIESETATNNESKTQSNKQPMQKPVIGPNLNGINQFQMSQRYPNPQNFLQQNPFNMGPAHHFQAGQRFAQGSNGQQPQPNQHPHSPDAILPGQYPFIPPVTPFRFNWDSAPIEPTQSYEPIPFMDNRAFNPAPVYPFVPPVNPYQFYQHFNRQY